MTAPDAIARAFESAAFITHGAAAALLGVDRKTLKKEGDDKNIAFAIVGSKSRRYAESDIRDYVAYLKARGTQCQLDEENEGPASISARKARSGNTTSDAMVYDFLAQHAKRKSERRSAS